MTYFAEVTAECPHCNEMLRKDSVKSDDRAYVLNWISDVRKAFRAEFPKAHIDSHFESSN